MKGRWGWLGAVMCAAVLGGGATVWAAPPDFAWGCGQGMRACVVNAQLLVPAAVGQRDALTIDVNHPDGTPAHFDSLVVSGTNLAPVIVNTTFYGAATLWLPAFATPGSYSYTLDAQGYITTVRVNVVQASATSPGSQAG